MDILLQMPGGEIAEPAHYEFDIPKGFQPLVGDILYKDYSELGDYTAWRVKERRVYNHMYSGGDMTYFESNDVCLILVLEEHIVEGS